MTDSKLKDILTKYRRIAVVGLSPDPTRSSHEVTSYMISQGYEIYGVRPKTEEVLGRPCFESLAEVPGPIEIVNVFRASEHIPEIARQAIAVKAKVLWLQLGVTHAEAEALARAAGIEVVSNRCILQDHARLLRE